ncbi:hypothetical protein KDK95_14750 [Actinospica sp. MGRD01-02]|uniref:Helix-turn-helix domain-containing protein n=1 Tax=Actinospica acidithermotolerans TaxID=2828514 RepID=A0A941EC12_9ACTN|nr:helix-turn-helix domain-containing protein [Actinospica acidithermotolerans]MBR7827575.1 hypothetical protein [Actinospica acidithermotolerans]
MRIHRTARTRYFTTLGNEVLRDSRLSYCARGVLGHLLSLPDGQRADIRTLTERTPEGRERVASALRELERFGYLRRATMRSPEGHLYTEVDVFDTPGSSSSQVVPKAGFPGSGAAESDPDGDHPVKERDEEPKLPAPPAADTEGGRAERGSVDTQASVDVLTRIARSEPKLSLGWSEALQLAPLVAEWRRRGASDLHIISSLTAGLPRNGVHHPLRFLETRLRSKMPVERSAIRPQLECDECGVPVSSPGLCAGCRGIEPSCARPDGEFARARSRGAALARAALRGLSIEDALPSPA